MPKNKEFNKLSKNKPGVKDFFNLEFWTKITETPGILNRVAVKPGIWQFRPTDKPWIWEILKKNSLKNLEL